jgi:hypothetical protein
MVPLSRYLAFRQRCPILEPRQAFAPDLAHVPDSSPMSSGNVFPAILRENSAKSRQTPPILFVRYHLVSSAVAETRDVCHPYYPSGGDAILPGANVTGSMLDTRIRLQIAW